MTTDNQSISSNNNMSRSNLVIKCKTKPQLKQEQQDKEVS